MRFGPVPVKSAEGGILAHTHRLSGGGALKKGRVLSAEDIERLATFGVVEVVVAQLDADDVPEDEAAATVARAAAADGVRVGEAATGRCNLYATHRGLLVFAPDEVDETNLVDEALTLGTLPNFSVVEPGTMVATIKIIPFAVLRTTVARCAAVARGQLAVVPFVPRRAGLIVTTLPGVHSK
ncbi:MAG: 4-diphosphocytidyl-2C-methyl-D-erythritol kinase, partial [Myxococcota bacterium]